MLLKEDIMNQATAFTDLDQIPAFCEGVQYFAESLPDLALMGDAPVLSSTRAAISDPLDAKAVYQTLLAADALRYLTLQVTAAKSSGMDLPTTFVTNIPLELRLANPCLTTFTQPSGSGESPAINPPAATFSE